MKNKGTTRVGRINAEKARSLEGPQDILVIDRDRLSAIELCDHLHLQGHVALWSDDASLFPAAWSFDLIMLGLTDNPDDDAAILAQLFSRELAPALAVMSDGDRCEAEAACLHAEALGFTLQGLLRKPLRSEDIVAALETSPGWREGGSGARTEFDWHEGRHAGRESRAGPFLWRQLLDEAPY